MILQSCYENKVTKMGIYMQKYDKICFIINVEINETKIKGTHTILSPVEIVFSCVIHSCT